MYVYKKKVKKRFLISVVAIIDTTLYVFLNVRLKFKNNLCLYYILLLKKIKTDKEIKGPYIARLRH